MSQLALARPLLQTKEKEKEKKRKEILNNDLAVLPSHNSTWASIYEVCVAVVTATALLLEQ